MADVAARAGVSRMTVSYAYSDPGRVSPESRRRVFDAADALGYCGPDPRARSLRQGRTRTLGVVLTERLSYAFDDPQAVAFLAGVADVCVDAGYGLTMLPLGGSPADVQRVREAAVDGFVLWTTADDDPVLDAVAATGRPTVIHGGPSRASFRVVAVDNRAAARAIGRVVLAGSARPAVVSFPLDRARSAAVVDGPDPLAATYPVTRDRLLGFRDAAVDLGVGWASVRVAVRSGNSVDDAALAAAGLLDDGRDAIAAMSDQQAIGVLQVARARGVAVPRELAVSGWDDSAAATTAGLTTIAQSLRDQGRTCALAALGLPADDADPPWSLVRRASTR